MNQRRSPNGKTRICLVVACSQRKRLPAPSRLQLRSVRSRGAERVAQWNARLGSIDAPRLSAADLYAGDHWQSAVQAHEEARLYSSGAELWVISAGYGLIRADSKVKPYSATFATRADDAVWRGPCDGDRLGQLDRWWDGLQHRTSLSDLIAQPDTVVVVAAGAPYITALRKDIAVALESAPEDDRLSIVSAGTSEGDGMLPVDGRFRTLVGGTDSSLNARVLAMLASEAATHRFRRSAMTEFVLRMASDLPELARGGGARVSDDEVARCIDVIRKKHPTIGRTSALQMLRRDRVACGQSRFKTIWQQTALPSKR